MSNEGEYYDYLYKILVVGDTTVGKSSMISRFCDGYYTDGFVSTIGVDFKFKTLEKNGVKCKLQIWDTAGQERFRSIVNSFYRGANLIMIVFDLTQKSTFEKLDKYLKDIENITSDVKKVIVGNKCDLEERQVERQYAENFAKERGFLYFETSAKSGKGVDKLFKDSCAQLYTSSSKQCDQRFEKPTISFSTPNLEKPSKSCGNCNIL